MAPRNHTAMYGREDSTFMLPDWEQIQAILFIHKLLRDALLSYSYLLFLISIY
jgi:hypothetical protein